MTDIGAALRQLRTERRMSQEKAALGVHLSRTQVGHQERGIRKVTPDNLKDYADAYGVTVRDIYKLAERLEQSVAPLQARATSGPGWNNDGESAGPTRSREILGGMIGAARDLEFVGGRNDPSEQNDDINAIIATAAEESSSILEWAEMSNVGELTIDQLHTEIRRISHDYLKVPTLPLIQKTRALRDRAFTLLQGKQKPGQTRDLYSAAGWALAVLAWISTDLGIPRAAADHLRLAWLCAENADQNNLRAWVRATQHTAAYWQGDYPTAAMFAEDGLRYADSGTVELFLASAYALDLASKGDLDGARQEFRRARIVADDLDSRTDELSGPFLCTLDRAAGGLWSDVYFLLFEPQNALKQADTAIADFETKPLAIRNLGSERMVRVQQAKAHLMLNQLDGAAETLAPVLRTEPQHRVLPLLHRVSEVGEISATLASTGKARARGISEAAREFCFEPDARVIAGRNDEEN